MSKRSDLFKTLLLVLFLALTAGSFAGCHWTDAASAQTTAKTETTLKVGAAPVPHSEILNYVKPRLKQEGVNLEVVVLDDDGQLNPALHNKQIDANYFQHVPYLNSVAKEKGFEFVVVANVHVEPIGFYSQKIKAKDELKEGAIIALSNNPSNEYRGLALLQQNGLIKIKDGITQYAATPRDIVENPKKLKFTEIDPAQLTRALPDVDGAVINTNRILDAKMDPNTALFREDAKSPYGNVVVVRKGDETRPEVQKLAKVLLSPEVKQFIQGKYGVTVVPAF